MQLKSQASPDLPIELPDPTVVILAEFLLNFQTRVLYSKVMLVLGIDPGTATTGYGLLQVKGTDYPELVKFGWIKTEKNGEPAGRLATIYKEFRKLLRTHSPDVMAMERIFFFANAKTVISVSQAQGVFLLAAAQSKIPVYQYAPGQVKLAIAGSGRADKTLMKQTIRKLFKTRAPNKKRTHFDDAADAVAIALCHIKSQWYKPAFVPPGGGTAARRRG